MQLYFLLFTALFTIVCIKTPDTPLSKEIVAKEKIQDNKTEALLAQDEYLKLQKQRDND